MLFCGILSGFLGISLCRPLGWRHCRWKTQHLMWNCWTNCSVGQGVSEKIILKRKVCYIVDWICLVQDTDHWESPVDMLHKIRGISCPTMQLSDSQEDPHSMELISVFKICKNPSLSAARNVLLGTCPKQFLETEKLWFVVLFWTREARLGSD